MAKAKAIGRIKPNDTAYIYQNRVNHVLAIGIDDYKYCIKLNNAVKDVKDIVAILKEKYGFESNNIKTLYNKEATFENIDDALKNFVGRVNDNDNLLIYFSGHGDLDQVYKTGYWVPVEAKASKTSQYFPNDRIQTALRNIKSHHTFLISDSCYSGSLFSPLGASRSASDVYDKHSSRWGLTSGRDTIVSDGEKGKNSPFAQSLLEILRDNNAPLNVGQLCDRVKVRVAALTESKQLPYGNSLNLPEHQGGEFLFLVSDKEEQKKWAYATQQQSVTAFKEYMQAFPHGKQIEEAKKYYQLLFWEENRQTKKGCEAYLKEFPTGNYYDEAFMVIQKVDIEEADNKILNEIKGIMREDIIRGNMPISLLDRILKPNSPQRNLYAMQKSRFLLYDNVFNRSKADNSKTIYDISRFFINLINVLSTADIFIDQALAYTEEERSISKLKQFITFLVEQRRVEEALRVLVVYIFDLAYQNEAWLLLSEYRGLQHDKIKGVLSFEDLTTRTNQILFRILKLSEKIDETHIKQVDKASIAIIQTPFWDKVELLIVEENIGKAFLLLHNNTTESSKIKRELIIAQNKYENLLKHQEAIAPKDFIIGINRIKFFLRNAAKEINAIGWTNDNVESTVLSFFKQKTLFLTKNGELSEAIDELYQYLLGFYDDETHIMLTLLKSRCQKRKEFINGVMSFEDLGALEEEILNSFFWMIDNIDIFNNYSAQKQLGSPQLENLKSSISSLVEERKIQEAINALNSSLVQTSEYKDVIPVLEKRYLNALKGLNDFWQLDVEENKILSSLLSIVYDIEEKDLVVQ